MCLDYITSLPSCLGNYPLAQYLDSTVAVEESYASGNYEITVRSTVTAEEDLPVKLCDLEKSEFVGESSQECGEAVHSLSTAGEMLRGSSESETVLPDVQDPADGQLGCGIYACSSCGITFSSVIEHIRMYHGGQEVVIEVCVYDLVAQI